MNKEELVNIKYNIRTIFRRNRLLRLAYLPFKYLSNRLKTQQYSKTEDSRYLASLRNRYSNQSCFIVGNGPSLSTEDLDRINCVSFGSNYIYKIFDQTSWRPQFYCAFDKVVIEKIGDALLSIPVETKFIDSSLGKKYRYDPSIHMINRINRYTINPYAPKMAIVNEKCENFVGSCYSVTSECIQLAIYMGFKTIYLLGIDHGFSTYYDLKGNLIVENGGAGNHFYNEKKVHAANAGCPYIVEEGYRLCKSLAEKRNVKIINVSRKTKLNIFERGVFEEICRSSIK